MQFTSFFTLALASTIIASPLGIVQGGVEEIDTALAKVEANLKAFDTALRNLDKSKLASELTSISGKGDVILNSMKAANNVIKGSGKLTVDEAITVASTAFELSHLSHETIEDLVKAKPFFEQAGSASALLKQLREQKDATLDMIKFFMAIIPPELQRYASPANKVATDAL
jgi:hypothetical protein